MSIELSNILAQTQAALLGADDTVCTERARLVTEADRRYRGLEPPLRRARCLEHILQGMTLDLQTNPVFAGCTSSRPRAWMLVPEFGLFVPSQVQIEHDHLHADWLQGKVPRDIVQYWADRQMGSTAGGPGGIGHMSIDFNLVVNRGLQAVVDDLEARADCGTAAEQTYRRAMAVGCRAVIGWAKRWAEAAEARAHTVPDPDVAACHCRVARACRRVPAHPARNLFEGLQSILLVHLATVVEGQGMSQSVGLPDRALARFADEAAAEPAAAEQLCRAFVLGLAANSFMGRGSKTQAVTVGGADASGRDCTNALSLALLEGFARTPVGDPHLFVRWHPGLDHRLWQRSMEVLSAGRSMPMLVNDQVVAPGLVDIGVTPADAWDYCIAGCNEIGIPGRATTTAFALGASVVDVAVLRDIVLQRDEPVHSLDELLGRYTDRVETLVHDGIERGRQRLDDLVREAPFPLTSACCRGAAEAGADYLVSMPYPHVRTVFVRGTANAIDALAALEHVVFVDGGMTPDELASGLEQDDPAALSRLAACAAWGADDPETNRLAVRLHEARQQALERVTGRLGHPVIACHVIRSLHHLSGNALGATPDGRPAGRPLSDSLGPPGGSGARGPTALLASVARLDARRYYKGCANLNLTLVPDQARPDVLASLCRTFFGSGGQELQVGVLDAEVLKHARRHPDEHADLVVRVAGLNARFVELSAREQDEMIERAERARG